MAILTPLVLGIISVLGFIIYVVAHQASVMKEVAAIHDPKLQLLRFVAAGERPECDIKVDEKAGTITYTDKKTGEWETIDYAEIGSGPTKTAPAIPAWVALYPGTSSEFVYTSRAQKKDGKTVGAKFILTSSDPIPKVKEFYMESVKAFGFKTETSAHHGTEFIRATADQRSLAVHISRTDPDKAETEIHLEYEEKQ